MRFPSFPSPSFLFPFLGARPIFRVGKIPKIPFGAPQPTVCLGLTFFIHINGICLPQTRTTFHGKKRQD